MKKDDVKEAKPAPTQHGSFELVRSIIHKCPALKLPQSFIEKLGNAAQIVPLKGLDDEMAKFIVDACNASLPAPGEAKPVAWYITDDDGKPFASTVYPHEAQQWRDQGKQVHESYAALPAKVDAQIDRDAVLDEVAEAIDRMGESAGDAAASDRRDMYPSELDGMRTLARVADAIRAMKGAAIAASKSNGGRPMSQDKTSFANFFGEGARANLRRVKFNHWKTKELTRGFFHQWGQEADGEGQSNPVAVVELQDGSVTTVYAGYITFEDCNG